MTWQGKRRATLPGNWSTIRARILRRDPTCQLGYECCVGGSTEVDHIGAPTDHRDLMLRGVCAPCHRLRTQQQARDANPALRRRRPPRQHPGGGGTPSPAA